MTARSNSMARSYRWPSSPAGWPPPADQYRRLGVLVRGDGSTSAPADGQPCCTPAGRPGIAELGISVRLAGSEPQSCAASLLPPLAVMLRLRRWCGIVVWAGLVGLTVALLVLMRTRWGQSQPLRKCIVLSLLAHLLLGIYTTTVTIVSGGIGPGDGLPLRVALQRRAPTAATATRIPIRAPGTTNRTPITWPRRPDRNQPAAARAATGRSGGTQPRLPAAGALPSALDAATSAPAHPRSAAATAGGQDRSRPRAMRGGGPPPRRSNPGLPPPATAPADMADPPPTRATPIDARACSIRSDPDGEDAATQRGKHGRPHGAGRQCRDRSRESGSPATAGARPGGPLDVANGPGRRRTATESGPGVGVRAEHRLARPTPVARNATDEDEGSLDLSASRRPTTRGRPWPTAAPARPKPRSWPRSAGWPRIRVRDGRWEAQRLEAGREAAIDGHPRRGPAVGPTRASPVWRCLALSGFGPYPPVRRTSRDRAAGAWNSCSVPGPRRQPRRQRARSTKKCTATRWPRLP